jgi:co-chaperonin GroES (HSP10)
MKVKVLRPCGNRYVVQLLEDELCKRARESKIVLDFANSMERAKRDVCVAKVLQRGISCKIESDRKTLWAKEGDHVLVNKYSWSEVPTENDGGLTMIINDEDILAIVEIEE